MLSTAGCSSFPGKSCVAHRASRRLEVPDMHLLCRAVMGAHLWNCLISVHTVSGVCLASVKIPLVIFFFFLMWNQNIFQEKALRKSEGKKKCSEDIGNMVCKALLHQKYIPLTAGPQFFYLQVTNGISCATEITGEEEADPECFQRYFSYHWQADELNLVPAAHRGSGKALAVPRAASQHPTRLFKGKKCLCPFVSGIRMSGRGAGAEGSSGSLLPPAAAKPDPLLQQALLSRRLSALSAAGGAEHFPT